MSCELPPGWDLIRLGDVLRVHHGFAFKGEYFSEQPPGDILVTPGNFKIGGGFSWHKPKYYRGPVDDRYVLVEGALLITMTDLSKASDTLGSPALCPQAPDGVRLLHNQRIGLVEILDEEKCDRGYLYAALRNEAYRQQIVAGATGTTVKHTSPSRIYDAVIPLPPIQEQRRIGELIGAVDKKIGSNERVVLMLHQLATTEFARRFGDVRPDGDNAASSGTLGELVEVTMGQSPPGSTYTADASGGTLLVQGMGGFGDRFPTSRIYTTAPTKRARAGATLMTVRAPVGAVNVAHVELCLGRGVAGIVGSRPAFTEYLIRALRRRWASEESGTIFPAVNRKQIVGLPVRVPAEREADAFERLANPIVAKLRATYAETATLVDIRVALVPKLTSGRVRIGLSASQRQVEELVA